MPESTEQQFQACAAYGCERKLWRGTNHCRNHGGNRRRTRLQEWAMDRGDWIAGPLLIGARPSRLWNVWCVKHPGVLAYGANIGNWTISLSWGADDD